MKRLSLIIFTGWVFIASIGVHAAPNVSICRDGNLFRVSGLSDIGWDAATGGGGFEGDRLIASPMIDGTIQVVFWWTDENGDDHFGEVWGNSNTPVCTGWQPSAPSILIPSQEGAFKLEIWGDGRWWLVTDDLHPGGIILTAQNGYVELIGSVGQDIDPSHYRLIEVTP